MVQRNIALPVQAEVVMKFDPMAQWGKVFETWQKMAVESIARTTALFEVAKTVEAERRVQAERTIEEMARMQKESVAYGIKLHAEWRKAALDVFQEASSIGASVSSPAS